MNYLVIDEDLVPELLSPELKRLYDYYMKSLEEKTGFDKLSQKFNSNRMSRAWYIEECLKLVRRVKYMTFDKRRLHFVVRPTINGKGVYLGASESFEEACKFVGTFLEEKRKLKQEQ